MDNSILNPIGQYLQPQNSQQIEEGLVCIVSEFDEVKRKFSKPNSKQAFFSEDLKLLFAKFTDKDGKSEIATFELNQIPNPVPVTDAEVSERLRKVEERVESRLIGFDAKLSGLESAIRLLTEKITGGVTTDGSNGVFQQKSDIAGSLVSKEPVFK